MLMEDGLGEGKSGMILTAATVIKATNSEIMNSWS